MSKGKEIYDKVTEVHSILVGILTILKPSSTILNKLLSNKKEIPGIDKERCGEHLEKAISELEGFFEDLDLDENEY